MPQAMTPEEIYGAVRGVVVPTAEAIKGEWDTMMKAPGQYFSKNWEESNRKTTELMDNRYEKFMAGEDMFTEEDVNNALDSITPLGVGMVVSKVAMKNAGPALQKKLLGNRIGKDKYWLDDSGMEMLADIPSGATPLDTLMKHPDLFEAYPDLKRMVIQGIPEGSLKRGVYNRSKPDTMGIQKGMGDETGATVGHELTHVIQNKEGLKGGGSINIKGYGNPVKAVEELNDLGRSMKDMTSGEFKVASKRWKDMKKNYDEGVEDYLKIEGENSARMTQAVLSGDLKIKDIPRAIKEGGTFGDIKLFPESELTR